ncbi:MAG TPA: MBL fold metallo-hydrolase [Thermomicrobiales bacterium]|nr:MBL fold metallo-hydrolase [Thermomicrobiales bacterium]
MTHGPGQRRTPDATGIIRGEIVEYGQFSVARISAGPIETNAFVVVDSASGDALIIDAPPDSGSLLAAEIARRRAHPVGLVLTHTHWDHIGDVAALAASLAVPVSVHQLEAANLRSPAFSPAPIDGYEADRLLADGDTVKVGGRELLVMHTPGHSPGQISLYSEPDGLLLGGDTLFPNGYGRVDIPGASAAQTIATIRRLLVLPDEVAVLPGHGEPTTIGRERHWMEQVAASGRLFE